MPPRKHRILPLFFYDFCATRSHSSPCLRVSVVNWVRSAFIREIRGKFLVFFPSLISPCLRGENWFRSAFTREIRGKFLVFFPVHPRSPALGYTPSTFTNPAISSR